MTDPLQAMLKAGGTSSLFPANSRYAVTETATLVTVEGRTIAHLRRRFVPAPDRFALLQEHTVVRGDRLDNLAARYLGDPEMFWLLCDANAAMRPEDLTEDVGGTLRITLPEGVPGAGNA